MSAQSEFETRNRDHQMQAHNCSPEFQPWPSRSELPPLALTSPSVVTVVVADDHELFREGIARVISDHSRLELVGQTDDGHSALAMIEELQPDVALLDLRMLGLDGIEACARVTEQGLSTKVVLLSAFLGPQLVSQAVEAGADGYLGKDISRDEICYALLEVARGGGAFQRRLGKDQSAGMPDRQSDPW